MKITTKGYPIKFIQTHPRKLSDADSHVRSYVFKFNSPATGLHYIVRAEEHNYLFFALKFYAKKDRRSDRKYYNIIDKGDVSGILVTAAKVVPYLLDQFPEASFGFFGSRSIDLKSDKVEGYVDNQRYRLYKYHIPQLIGDETFEHYSYKNASAYSLINRGVGNVKDFEEKVRAMLANDYEDLMNIEPN